MGVIAEDILLGWRQGLLTMKLGREVGCIKGPDRERLQEGTPAFKFPRGGRGREQRDVYQVWQQKRPEQRNGTCEEEPGQKDGDSQRMAKDHQGLQASLKADVQRCPVDAVRTVNSPTLEESCTLGTYRFLLVFWVLDSAPTEVPATLCAVRLPLILSSQVPRW